MSLLTAKTTPKSISCVPTSCLRSIFIITLMLALISSCMAQRAAGGWSILATPTSWQQQNEHQQHSTEKALCSPSSTILSPKAQSPRTVVATYQKLKWAETDLCSVFGSNLRCPTWMSACRSFRNTLTKWCYQGATRLNGSSSVDQVLLELLPDGNVSGNRSHTMGNHEYLEIIIRGTMFLSCKKSGAMLLPSE